MSDELPGTPTGTTPGEATPGSFPAPDDLQQQDPAVTGASDPDALPAELAAAHEEIRGLRSVKGDLGNKYGQAKQDAERERQERQRIEQELAALRAQPQQPPPPAREAPPAPKPEDDPDFVDDFWERHANLTALEQVKAQAAEALGNEYAPLTDDQIRQQAWQRAFPGFQRRQAQEQKRQEQFQQVLEQAVAPLRFRDNFEQAKERAGIADVTVGDLENVAVYMARRTNTDPEQTKAAIQRSDPAGLEVLALAALGLKSKQAPTQATATIPDRATPQRPVNTGPGVAPTSTSPDREVLQLAETFKARGYYSHMPAKDADAEALAAARETLGR